MSLPRASPLALPLSFAFMKWKCAWRLRRERLRRPRQAIGPVSDGVNSLNSLPSRRADLLARLAQAELNMWPSRAPRGHHGQELAGAGMQDGCDAIHASHLCSCAQHSLKLSPATSSTKAQRLGRTRPWSVLLNFWPRMGTACHGDAFMRRCASGRMQAHGTLMLGGASGCQRC